MVVLKLEHAGPTSRVSESVGLGQSPEFTSLTGNADAAGRVITLREPLSHVTALILVYYCFLTLFQQH